MPHVAGTTDEEVRSRHWASLDNPTSFWIEKRHLLQTLCNVGFSIVRE